MNKKTHLNGSSRFLLPLTVFATLLWWVAGWIMPNPPSWWGVPFILGVILVGGLLWVRARQQMRAIHRLLKEQEKGLKNKQAVYQNQNHMTHAHERRQDQGFDAHGRASSEAGTVSEALIEENPDIQPYLPLLRSMSPGPIRAFASVADGIRHGWIFEQPVGTYAGDTLFHLARRPAFSENLENKNLENKGAEEEGLSSTDHDGKEQNPAEEYFVFDGLSKNGLSFSDSQVTFGHIRYRKVDSLPAAI